MLENSLSNNGIEDNRQKCLICGYESFNRRSLGNHVNKHHKIDLEDYTLYFKLHGIVPKCICGCGGEVKWHKLQYHYNDYLTGHNPAGFKVKQPIFTSEQLQHRGDAIRRAYTERKDEITKKISDSVTKTFEDPIHKENLSAARIKQWLDPEFRKKSTETRRRVWAEHHDELCAKIFTPEFGKKISLANMRRELCHTSKAELAFVEKLRAVFDNVEQSKWFNLTERTWCADAWIPELNAIIEFDGIYWHGLGKKSDFTLDQVVNLTNDLTKNALARKHKLTIFRIAEDADISNLQPTIESLTLHSYHAVIVGDVIKEGSFAIDEIMPTISRESLIKMNEIDIFSDASGREFTEKEILPAMCDLFRAHVGYWGWFYPVIDTSVSIKDVMCSMLESVARVANNSVATGTAGSKWLKSFVRSYWNVDNGPATSFLNDKKLIYVMKYRLGLNNSKSYDYVLSDGKHVSCRETFDINLKNIRYGFVVQRNNVSWFRPCTAASVYTKFLKGIKMPIVWDPSIGFSARLFGFAATCPGGKYIGTDPAEMMCSDARNLADELNGIVDVDIRCCGSEVAEFEPESIDFVFTSPPYFDKEQYVDAPGQCWRDHPTLESWTKDYLVPTFTIARNALKLGAFIVINVYDDLVNVVAAAATEVGFTRRADMDMSMTIMRDHFHKKNGYHDNRQEPFLAFQK